MAIKRRVALVIAALLGVVGLNAGVARAQPSLTARPPAAPASAPPATGLPRVALSEIVEELHQANPPPGGYTDAEVPRAQRSEEVE